MKIQNDFLPYQPSLELKELGFDEPCFGFYRGNDIVSAHPQLEEDFVLLKQSNFTNDNCVSAPLYQQAFRWFREKHELFYDNLCYTGNVWKFTTYSNNVKDYFQSEEYNTYEEAELACLIKLIELCRKSQ